MPSLNGLYSSSRSNTIPDPGVLNRPHIQYPQPLLTENQRAEDIRISHSVSRLEEISDKLVFGVIWNKDNPFRAAGKGYSHFDLISRPLYKVLGGRYCPLSSTIASHVMTDYLVHQLPVKVLTSKKLDSEIFKPTLWLTATFAVFGLLVSSKPLLHLNKEFSSLQLLQDFKISNPNVQVQIINLLKQAGNILVDQNESVYRGDILEKMQPIAMKIIKILLEDNVFYSAMTPAAKTFMKSLSGNNKLMSESMQNVRELMLKSIQYFADFDRKGTQETYDRLHKALDMQLSPFLNHIKTETAPKSMHAAVAVSIARDLLQLLLFVKLIQCAYTL